MTFFERQIKTHTRTFDYQRYYYKVSFKIIDGVVSFNTATSNVTTDTINGMSISSEKVIEL